MPPTNPPVQPQTSPKNPKQLIIWGWILTLLIPVTIAASALVSLATANSFNSPIQRAMNVIVFLVGAVGIIGFPVGVILLVVGYTTRHKQQTGPTGPGPQ